jgi:PAS domain S-box-containing protein
MMSATAKKAGSRGRARTVPDRKRAEKAIEDMAQFPAENPNPVLRISRAGLVLYCNEAGRVLLRQWGIESGQRVPDDIRAMVRKALAGQEPMNFEIAVKNRLYAFVIHTGAARDYVNLYGVEITERRRVEEETRLSRQRLALHVQKTPLAVIEFDLDRRVVAWNPAAERIFGYSQDEAFGQKWTFIVPEEIRGPLDGVWKSIMSRRGGGRSSNANRTKDGRTIFCKWFSTALIDPAGKTIGMASICQDITEQQQAKEEIQRQNATLNGILNSSNQPIFSVDTHYRYTSFNSAHADLMRALYGADIKIGGSLLDYHTNVEDRTKAKANINRTLNGEQFAEDAYAGEEARERRYFEITHNPVREAGGAVTGVAVLARDMTDRKRAEEALRASEMQFRALSENALSGVYIIQDGRLIYVNAALADIFGYAPDELIGADSLVLVQPSDHAFVAENQRRRMAGEIHSIHYEFRGRCKNGATKHIEVFGSRIDLNGRAAIVGNLLDITDRLDSEKRIRDFSQKILAAREEEKRSLAAALHHDVGSLSISVSSRLNAAEDELRDGKFEKAITCLAESRRMFEDAMSRMKQLASELRPPDLDVLGLAAALRHHFAHQTRDGSLRIQFTDDTKGKTIRDAPATVLFRVAQEALTNSIRHAAAKRIWVWLTAKGKEIRISLKDDGKGFDLARVATDGKPHLGLQSMEEMASSLGGRFEVRTAPGRGTEVIASFPQGDGAP